MAKPRKTDTKGQPEANTGLDENQPEGANMENLENPETDETQNAAPAEGSTEPGEAVSEDLNTLPEPAAPDTPAEPATPDTPVASVTSKDEQAAIALLFNKVMGHDSMPKGWTLQNSTKLVRDAWANSKHGRPYPGYDSALIELTKDL